MDANGSAQPGGVTQFVVGTGGKDDEPADIPGPTVIAQNGTDFGVLKLTLHASSADYAFQTTGGTVPDAGTVNCSARALPPSADSPAVSGVAPLFGSSAGGTQIQVSGSNFTTASTVSVGGNPATNVTVTSPTSLRATVPPMTAYPGASTVDVTVTTTNGTSTVSPADQFTYTFATNGYSGTLAASTTTPPSAGQSPSPPTPTGVPRVSRTVDTIDPLDERCK